MSDFTLPTNIKQIGSIEDGLRIYVEDYVCTYLYQYAESGGYDERAALLVGRFMVIDGQAVLFINGAVQGKFTEEKDGLLSFSEKDKSYAEAMIAEFFEGMEIVGWMQSQPSYGVYLNQHYAAYHLKEFTRDYAVMFVMDPIERINAFYVRSEDRSSLTEARGYFIYYDKNKNMHDYMLKDKITDYKTQPPSYISLTRAERAEEAAHEESPEKESVVDKTTETIRRHQAERMRKKNSFQQRRTVNLLVSLSAVMFVVCFIMGAGLIQNQDRISQMEEELVKLSTAYRNLFVQMNAEGTTAVFAAQSDEESPAAASGQVIEENGAAAEESVENAPVHSAAPEAPASTSAPANDEGERGSAGISEESAAPAEAAANALADAASSLPTSEPVSVPANTAAEAEAETAPAAVVSSVPEAYTIQPGDSLIAISIRYYGDSSRVNDILSLNGIANADKIVAGKTIALPRP